MNKEKRLQTMANFILVMEQLLVDTHQAEDRRIYVGILSFSAPIIAKAICGQPFDNDVNAMERYFGEFWLSEAASYEKAYTAWKKFKDTLP